MSTTIEACFGQDLADEGMRKKRTSNNRSSKIKPLGMRRPEVAYLACLYRRRSVVEVTWGTGRKLTSRNPPAESSACHESDWWQNSAR